MKGAFEHDLVDNGTVCTVRQKQKTLITTTFLCVERGRDSWQDRKDFEVGDDSDPCEVLRTHSSQAVLGRGRERIPWGATTGRGVDRRYCCRVIK